MKLTISANFAWNIYSRRNLLKAFKKEGWEVIAIACQDNYAEILEKELSVKFYPVRLENKGMNVFSDIHCFFSYLFLYCKIKPDVVLHFNSKPDIYGSMAASILGIPSVNNVTGLGMTFDRNDLVHTIVSCLYKTAFYAKKNFVFFQNKDDLACFMSAKLININKTDLLPGSGVDIERFHPTTSSKKTSVTGSDLFLFSGRLVLSKGIREYLEAARIVRRLYPNTRFDIIGEHEAHLSSFIPFSEIIEAEKAGDVFFLGNVADVVPLIAKADCVVLPSYYREGVPRVLLEAAAMGKPLIAADSIGTREPVRDGINGYLCKPRDAQDLADKIIRFICLSDDKKKAMGMDSRKIAENEYSDAIVIAKYLERLSCISDTNSY